ncbi:hypothetical protein B0H66DRAFT_536292 [Apodospora peruviana]|uniref:Uncharacterized protein n=1 Tax=Apodospora peruviana TaxID=516989 RepID=A0AAE0M195_9PEZI|nr:hypothetical protein B0H66DRAFT_536292 [Apodospora peruviana]
MRSGCVTSITSTCFIAIAFGLFLLVALATIRSDTNQMSALQFCIIDTSITKVKINGYELVGLPDPFDYSRHKQIFKVYLLNYCSDHFKPGTCEEVIDFCSKPREVIWGLFTVWSLWGVQLRLDGGAKFEWLDRGPNWLWIASLVGICASGLGMLMSLAQAHRHYRLKFLVVFVSVLAACAQLATAITAQVTYGALVSKAHDDNISITAKLGLQVVGKITPTSGGKKAIWTGKSSHAAAYSSYTEVKDADSGAVLLVLASTVQPQHGAHNGTDLKYEPYRGAHGDCC